MKDPGWYLLEIGVTLPCAVTKGVQARLTEPSSARVNHEVFYFSMPGAKRKFLADPLKYCDRLTDPVSGVRFPPSQVSPRQEWNGRPYYFASAATAAVFAEDPERYAEPMGRMIQVPEDRGPEEETAPEAGEPPAGTPAPEGS